MQQDLFYNTENNNEYSVSNPDNEGQHFPLVDDFFLGYGMESGIIKENSFKYYVVLCFIIMIYIMSLICFLLCQFNDFFTSCNSTFIKSISRFSLFKTKYAQFYAVLLLIAMCLSSVLNDPKIVYVFMCATAFLFFVLAISKTTCKNSIRWPMLSASLVMISYVILNLCFIKNKKNETSNEIENAAPFHAFFYFIFRYTTVIIFVLILIDYFVFLEYKCLINSNPPNPLNGFGNDLLID